MFYSNDLLGKKSPLGAVWVAAHGKKLSKGKVLQVNIGETCKHIMAPEVPHALRLQAILVGGVVIIFNRQQGFLLDDANEMLRRVRAMTETSGGQGPTLEKKKNKAKAETITMPAEDVLGDFDVDYLFPVQLLGGLEHSLGGGPGPEASDELFVVPTLAEGDAPWHGARSECLRLMDMEDGVRLSLDGLERFDLNMEQPEMFEMPADMNLDLPGMDMFDVRVPLPSGGQGGVLPDSEGELFPVPSDPQLQGEGEDQQLQPRIQTPQTSGGKTPSNGGAAPRTHKKKRGKGKKVLPMVDLGDEVQIRGKVYREWMLDRSDLLMPRPTQRAAAAHTSPLITGPATTSLLVVPWPAELMELFTRNATLGTASTAAKPKCKAAGAAEAEGEEFLEQQERQLDEMAYPQADLSLDLDYGYGNLPMDAGPGWGLGEELDAQLAAAEGNPFRRRDAGRRRAASEATEDIETERLRAVLNNTPGSNLDAFYTNQLGLTPASNDPLLGGQLTNRNKRTRASSLRPDTEGALSEKSSGDARTAGARLSDLGGDLDSGDMVTMLPVVVEEEEFHGGAEGVGQGGTGLPASRKRQRLGEAGGSGTQGLGGTGTYSTVSQFQLLEESGPGTQPLGPAECINGSTMALIGLLRSKFDQLESQGGSGPSELSLFDMSTRLKRSEAAKLFAQILVIKSNDFIQAKQEEPYGDIIITRSAFL